MTILDDAMSFDFKVIRVTADSDSAYQQNFRMHKTYDLLRSSFL